jgi:hypothetical protein
MSYSHRHPRFRTAQTRLLQYLTVVLVIAGASLLPVGAQEPFISEFMAANNSGLRDSDGDFSDWIEIYNPGREHGNVFGGVGH